MKNPSRIQWTSFQRVLWSSLCVALVWQPRLLAQDAIDSKYNSLLASGVDLGTPKSAKMAYGSGWYRQYDRGFVFWSQATGAHELRDPLYGTWWRLRDSQGYTRLGYPVSDQELCHAGFPSPRIQRFERGTLVWYLPPQNEVVLEGIFTEGKCLAPPPKPVLPGYRPSANPYAGDGNASLVPVRPNSRVDQSLKNNTQKNDTWFLAVAWPAAIIIGLAVAWLWSRSRGKRRTES